MSVQNILVDNNLTIYAKDINTDDNIMINGINVATILTSTVNINCYYNGNVVAILGCNFIRIKGKNYAGACIIKIPAFNIPVSATDIFYLDLSTAPDFPIISLNNQLAQVVNNSLNEIGAIYGDPINNRIYISRLSTTIGSHSTFINTGNAGLSFNVNFEYGSNIL